MDLPKSLRSTEARAERARGLRSPHMIELTRFVADLRKEAPAVVPNFDPLDGGVKAECLFLLEAPGPQAKESGFVSRNNPDETAATLFAINVEADLPRHLTAIWNAVPWFLGEQASIRAATSGDLLASREPLTRLFRLLPRLRVVVLLGRKAQRFQLLLIRQYLT